MSSHEDEFDADIEAMSLSYVEKSGLQVYRNYTRAFDNHAEKMFAKEVDEETWTSSEVERVVGIITHEDQRFLPMIACAFADDCLKEMFRREIPDGVPGGKSDLLGRMGPFSDLAKRLQLAYTFELIDSGLCAEVDKLRHARNKLAHSWDISSLREFYSTEKLKNLEGPVDILHERDDWFHGDIGELTQLQRFRLNVIWLITRLEYETKLWSRAKKRRLTPMRALYGPNHPGRLGKISLIAVRASREIVTSR